MHIVPRLPRKRGGDPRDARAYIRSLAMHIVPRLPRKRDGDPRDARAHIRPLGNAHCPTPATQKRRRPKGHQGVHEWVSEWVCEWWVSECVSEWMSEWVSEWVGGWVRACVREWVSVMSECVWDEWVSDEGGGREEGADTELKTKTPHANVGNYDFASTFSLSHTLQGWRLPWQHFVASRNVCCLFQRGRFLGKNILPSTE